MQKGPIVFLSVFKSGTHAVRYILEELTGLPHFEPVVVRGHTNYRDPNQLRFVEDHYYSWHLIPGPEVCEKLRAAQARPVFLLRNPADLAVSMYHHFADNIDADIGRGRDVEHHFANLSKHDGLMAIINGLVTPDFLWAGLGPHLQHMARLLEFAQSHPSFVTTYSRITGGTKRTEVERLARFLGANADTARLDAIVEQSAFELMRARAKASGAGSHYRKGRIGGHRCVLDAAHYEAIAQQQDRWAPKLAGLLDAAGLELGSVARAFAKAC